MKVLKVLVIAFLAMYVVNPTTAQEKKDQVFMIVEDMPEFPGGKEALKKYIGSSVKYPEMAKKKGIAGKVYVSFVVSKDGEVIDAEIARGVDPILDKEALRVIGTLPKWKPGKQRGENVAVKFTVPIAFILDGKSKKMGEEKVHSKEIDGKTIFYIVEEMPEFPGGELALKKFISNSIKYPVVAQENGIQGKVYVTFIVNKEGQVEDTKIARGVDPSLDKEALRVINELPKWKPGKQRGEAVCVSYTVPISFALQ